MKTFADFGIEIPYGKTGGNVKTFCPQCHDTRHNKTDRSLSVNLDEGIWNCHYCGFHGSLNDEESKKAWVRQQAWYNPQPLRRQHIEYKKPETKAVNPTMSDKALAWFKGRGISKETLDAVKVTEGMEWMPQKGKEFNTVQFNYYLNGELVNVKYRTGDKCFKMVQGARLIPYNIDAIKGEKTCLITEGEMDALSFYEVGYHNVVSVPNGANTNLEYLDDFIEEYFEDKETIYIASDSDTKGIELRNELVRRFGQDVCRVLEYGEGCKDANEHLQKYGADSLRQIVEGAPEPKIEGVFTVADFEDNLDHLFEYGMEKGVTIGHENFDKYCSFESRRLAIVTGIPGSGKSEFIDEIAERLNTRYGWKFAYFSPENAPLAYHASKLISKFTGKRFDKKQLRYGEYKQAKEYLSTNFFFVYPHNDYRLDTILQRAKALVRRRGIKALVIDPYNRLEDDSGAMSETKFISRQLDKMTNFAQQNDVLVILMAHPTKLKRNNEGVIEPPTLYDISGSANFYNKCDYGLVVHRNNERKNVEVHVQKVRFRHLGEIGTAYFAYNLNNGRYTPWYEGQEPEWDNSNHIIEGIKAKIAKEESYDMFSGENLTTLPSDQIPF